MRGIKTIFLLLLGSFGTYAYGQTCDGGMVSTPAGDTTVYTCPDGTADVVNFSNNSSAATNYAYVITDQNGVILGLPPADSLDFDGAGVGVCLVWGLSYTGTVTAMPGDNALTTSLASGCFDLSDNYISVKRDNPDGAMVSMPSGATMRYTCAGDGTPDVVQFVNTSTTNSNYRYVVTDQNGVILGLPPGNSLDFEGAGTGVCLVWGLSYTGTLTAQAGDNALTTALTDDCFDLSDNFITVNRDTPDGATVSMPSGATMRYTCAGDGVADVVQFVNTSTANSNYRYVVTDQNGVILGLPPGNSLDFEGAGTGVCLVWGLSYTGTLTAQPGDNALTTALTDDCFDLSDNFITVNRDTPDGAMVSLPNGDTTYYTCAGDGVADVVNFVNTSTANSQYRYVITDVNGVILGLPPGDSLDFDGAGTGICLVWGLSYTGTVTAMPGDNALTTALSDDCFDLSDNYITVKRDNPDGATVSMPSGAVKRYTCAGDGMPDVVSFVNTSTANSQYRYIVTDENGVILGLPPGNSLDFEGAGTGTCLVWGLSYTGMFTAQPGDNALTTALTTDCFDLSDNFIEIIRSDQCVTGFTLVDAVADLDIMPLMDGMTIDLANLGTEKLNIRADIMGGDIESVLFGLNGDPSFANRNRAPFALYGALPNGNYHPWVATPGTYTISATPFESKNSMGDMGTPQTITITIIDTPPFLQVTSFTLVNAQTDQDIMTLSNGDVVNLSSIGTDRLNVRANVAGDVESVVFGLNGNANFANRNLAPYALGGASVQGNYWPMIFATGSYNVEATPYTSKNAGGTAGMTETVTFSVVSTNRVRGINGVDGITVYPNPTSQSATLRVQAGEPGEVSIRVISMQGQTVMETQAYALGQSWEYELNLEQVPAGVYLIQYVDQQGIQSRRLIKE